MGCRLPRANKIQITSIIKNLSVEQEDNINQRMSNYANRSLLLKIHTSSLLIILDYMSFVEIKEIGKLNRLFNNLAKQNTILIKFFKKKITPKHQIDSFSVFGKYRSISNYSTSSDNAF